MLTICSPLDACSFSSNSYVYTLDLCVHTLSCMYQDLVFTHHKMIYIYLLQFKFHLLWLLVWFMIFVFTQKSRNVFTVFFNENVHPLVQWFDLSFCIKQLIWFHFWVTKLILWLYVFVHNYQKQFFFFEKPRNFQFFMCFGPRRSFYKKSSGVLRTKL